MKLLLAADGSKFTKKALAFLVTHQNLAGPNALIPHSKDITPGRA